MRSLHVLSVVALLAGAIGCTLFDKRSDTPRPSTPVAKVSANQLIDYLNERASRLQSISAEVRFTAREGLIAAVSLHGDLSASQPRNFRMTGLGGAVPAKVDLGSNYDQFWVYLEAPTTKPMFVYASHSDFEAGRAKLPGGLPFEPDWVMQALGMHKFPKDIQYNEPLLSQSDRTYTLSWQTMTPSKMAIKKEVVFDADEARDGRPQVKKHLIKDSKNKLLCSAEVKKVSSVPIGGFDQRSPQLAVQYPTHVVLRWEVQNFELDLTLERAQVNQEFSDEQKRRLFSRPAEYPTQALDLAKYEFSAR
jgi:hypothetical protein